MKMNIETFSEPTLFFSNAHSIGTLKSFSFFNEDEENQNKLLHFFNEIIQNKYYNLLNSTNLIEYDMILLFTYMEQYYNQTEKDRVMSENRAYKKNEIAYVTQLFTPEWIVNYLVIK